MCENLILVSALTEKVKCGASCPESQSWVVKTWRFGGGGEMVLLFAQSSQIGELQVQREALSKKKKKDGEQWRI